jgi:hypothetical protein
MTTLLIAVLFVLVLDLAATCLVAYGVANLRDDFKWWQTCLFRIDQLQRAMADKSLVDSLRGKPFDRPSLQKWLDEHPDRPRRDDPPFSGPSAP